MTTQTRGATTLIRVMIIAVFVALLTVPSEQRAGASQSGVDVDTVALQAGICRLLGGTATIESYRTVGGGLMVMMVSCAGGLLGNWWCTNSKVLDPTCYRGLVRPAQEDAAPATGGVEVVDEAPQPTPEIVAEVVTSEPVVEPGVTEEPAPADDAVTPTPDPTDVAVDPDLVDEVVVDGPVVDDPVVDESPIQGDVFDSTLVEDPIVDGSVSGDDVVSEFVVYEVYDISAEDATLVGP